MASLLRRALLNFAIRRGYGQQPVARRKDSIFTKYREPPNGFLFNEKPRKPGERRKWETWEYIWNIGMGTTVLILVVGSIYKPDKGPKMWARPEALRRIAEKEAAEAAALEAAATASTEE